MSRLIKLGGVLAASALALTACGASNSGGAGGEETKSASDKDWANCTPGDGSKDASDLTDDDKDVSFAVFNGWDESYATTYLIKNVLEADGYKVKTQELDAGPAYTGITQGDVDFVTDTWLPLTHASYLEKFGDKMVDHGCWYDNAKLTIAVNEDSPAKTIEDLKTMGDEYDNTLYGIEAGAGLTETTKEKAIPEYGLEDLDYKISSTPAMLAQLKKSTDADENVAVTLWRPHWAYDAFPVRDLKDPKNAMGDAERVYSFSGKDAAEEHPYVSQLLQNLVLDDDHLASLENLMFSEDNYNGKDHEKAVAKWLKENPDFVDQWKKGELAK
ncbi:MULTISPECIES: glycine betaine ABC transporter substrate-binding protein [unclassified Brevibacterium]|uniref:glycine betaine ABC transporter substrate-binding protein n=1 Tax=unclassified Brevibacterium TaxID=2614124 RepID=UPI000C6712E6|nr:MULTISPECIES: glycine betaine ABC transporter substrate-binding protein [unclassified Brevibacterium]SMX83030.1 glycine betaine/proline transport system substrate-binding protein [Brevibacterium sp. 239c]